MTLVVMVTASYWRWEQKVEESHCSAAVTTNCSLTDYTSVLIG